MAGRPSSLGLPPLPSNGTHPPHPHQHPISQPHHPPHPHFHPEEKKVASAKEKSIQWGSRSVDIFEKIDQIGEGTYGYASLIFSA